MVLPLDVRDPVALAYAHAEIVAAWDGVTDLVLAAGLNTRTRYWRDQSLEKFEGIVATNLTAVVRVIDTVLPGMRARGSGQVVVVSSYSAWRFSPHAGVAYTASKTALAAVCASLNAQEAGHGIRACHLCPGDVDTEFLALRPQGSGCRGSAGHAVAGGRGGRGALRAAVAGTRTHRRTGDQPRLPGLIKLVRLRRVAADRRAGLTGSCCR